MLNGSKLCSTSYGKASEEDAQNLLRRNLFRTMMVYMGLADGLASARFNSNRTQYVQLQIIKTNQVSLVSGERSSWSTATNARNTLFSDCAINTNPNAQELAEIAESAKQLNYRYRTKRCTMLSFSTKVFWQPEEALKVAEAIQHRSRISSNYNIDGDNWCCVRTKRW